ncbi:MAG: hypothetical protein RBU45_19650 [Myxococcota bacterium]|jgi:hypothetical protein|nr:hypothetical protein [Myxococcota bacterium]
MKRYWITTHWPPARGDDVDAGVYLFEGRQDVGQNLAPGDLVWIYESRTGRKELGKKSNGFEGREGIVGLAELITPLQPHNWPPTTYADGTTRHWRWYAAGEFVDRSGYIDRQALNTILGYKEGYRLRGFGRRNSGLKEIEEDIHHQLQAAFVAGSQATCP